MKTILIALLMTASLQAYSQCDNYYENMAEELTSMKMATDEKDRTGWRVAKNSFLYWNKKVIIKCTGRRKEIAEDARKSLLAIIK